jgi:hypothetical protein
MVRGRHRKRLERKVGKTVGWVHGKKRLINERYHCDKDEKRIPMV